MSKRNINEMVRDLSKVDKDIHKTLTLEEIKVEYKKNGISVRIIDLLARLRIQDEKYFKIVMTSFYQLEPKKIKKIYNTINSVYKIATSAS